MVVEMAMVSVVTCLFPGQSGISGGQEVMVRMVVVKTVEVVNWLVTSVPGWVWLGFSETGSVSAPSVVTGLGGG
jgi:hypothetical protein